MLLQQMKYFVHLIVTVAGFPPLRLKLDPRSSHVGFVVDKVYWGRFSLSTSASPSNSYSTKCSRLICHPGLVQEAD
jgi:hypothetical protein